MGRRRRTEWAGGREGRKGGMMDGHQNGFLKAYGGTGRKEDR